MLIPLILTIISATEPFEIDTGGDGLQVRSDRVALQREIFIFCLFFFFFFCYLKCEKHYLKNR